MTFFILHLSVHGLTSLLEKPFDKIDDDGVLLEGIPQFGQAQEGTVL